MGAELSLELKALKERYTFKSGRGLRRASHSLELGVKINSGVAAID